MDWNFKFLGETGFPGAELIPSSVLNEVDKGISLILIVWAEANEVGRE